MSQLLPSFRIPPKPPGLLLQPKSWAGVENASLGAAPAEAAKLHTTMYIPPRILLSAVSKQDTPFTVRCCAALPKILQRPKRFGGVIYTAVVRYISPFPSRIDLRARRIKTAPEERGRGKGGGRESNMFPHRENGRAASWHKKKLK